MKKVLIADDNRIALEGMKKVIDWKSFDCELVAFCTNGEEVWDIIQKEPIDIVITDVEMPKMNGITLLEKINEYKPEIKLIFMSCYEDFNFVKSAIDMNARRCGKSCVNSIKTDLLGENYGRNNFYQGGFST